MIKNTILLALLSCTMILFGCDANEPISPKTITPATKTTSAYQAGDNFTAQKGDTLSATSEDTQVNIKTNIKIGSSVVTILSGAVELTKKKN